MKYVYMYVTARFPVKTYLGSHMHLGGLFKLWPQGHQVKSQLQLYVKVSLVFKSVLVQIVSVFVRILLL